MAKAPKQSLSIPSAETLANNVEISRQFLRSVRLDADLGRMDALDGYIFQGSARAALESMAKQVLSTQQRAFTWTGPYGGGKSSLALALASLVSNDGKLRAKARKVLHVEPASAIAKAFPPGKNGWTVVPVVGRRAPVGDCIWQALQHATGSKARTRGKSSVLAALVSAAEQAETNGVLLIIDELGKFLEAAALNGDDVFFYQELAEAASRTKGRLVVVGILHQAFEAYATRLGRDAREEWAKVQGRFIDIPLIAGTDEVVELVGRAITVSRPVVGQDQLVELSENVAMSMKKRRPGSPASLAESLRRCWPLHPATAALLGPVSRRRFGQNERGTFGFLASKEPLGFHEFLHCAPPRWQSMFTPARYWEYLAANLELAILASADGHRWAMSSEAVARAEAKGNPLHVELTKTVAVIDLFRNGSGLAPDQTTLLCTLPEIPERDVRSAMEDLARWSILIFRKHLDAWGIYAGSDFDIDAAVTRARSELAELDTNRVAALADLQPVVAKRLYYETGTLRWLTRSLVSGRDLGLYVRGYRPANGSSGEFLLVLPEPERSARDLEAAVRATVQQQCEGLLIGVPTDVPGLLDTALEVMSLERVFMTSPELEGDLVARREIESRMTAAKVALGEALREAFASARWFERGRKYEGKDATLPKISSEVAGRIYAHAPHLFSELLNRDRPSSSAVKARRDLLYRMMKSADEENLGYKSFSADAGLYYTLLRSTGLHGKGSDSWTFQAPSESIDADGRAESLLPIWSCTLRLLENAKASVTLHDIYSRWQAPPFGVRGGVCPVLAAAFFLANRQRIAVYIENVFIPELTEAQIDEWMQDEHRVAFRLIDLGIEETGFLTGLAGVAAAAIGRTVAPEALDVARSLVSAVVSMPGWSRRTTSLSEPAQLLRNLLLRAHDPNRLVFSDLPATMQKQGKELIDTVATVLAELQDAYSSVLGGVEKSLFKSLDHSDSESLDLLRARAATIAGISGDFQVNAFIGRLAIYTGALSDVEGLVGLAANRSPREFVDRDIDAAVLKLGEWAHQFRRVETMASLRGRTERRRALGLVFGGSAGRVVSTDVEVADRDTERIDVLAKEFLAVAAGQRREVALAALAEVGVHLAQQEKEMTS